MHRAFETLCARCAGREPFDGEATWKALRDTEAPEPIVVQARRLHAALDAARFGGVAVPRDEVLSLATALCKHGELVAA